jgi:hypothetical protein
MDNYKEEKVNVNHAFQSQVFDFFFFCQRRTVTVLHSLHIIVHIHCDRVPECILRCIHICEQTYGHQFERLL